MRTLILLAASAVLSLGALGCLQTGKQSVRQEARLSALEQKASQLEQAIEQERQARSEGDEALRAEIEKLRQEPGEPPGQNATAESAPLRGLETEKQPEALSEEGDQPPEQEKRQPETEASRSDSPGAARQLYQEALDTLLSGNPMRSQNMFKRFIEEHPESPLLPNAYYWLGESYYVQKQFAQSILAFKEVSNQFPDDPKAPDALLKMGYAYANLDQDSNARFYLETLVKKYPDTKSAKLAQKRLESLR